MLLTVEVSNSAGADIGFPTWDAGRQHHSQPWHKGDVCSSGRLRAQKVRGESQELLTTLQGIHPALAPGKYKAEVKLRILPVIFPNIHIPFPHVKTVEKLCVLHSNDVYIVYVQYLSEEQGWGWKDARQPVTFLMT
jgi:hypothetical protein